MRIDKILLVFRKDWLEVRRNWEIMVPIIIVPLIFSVVLPSMMLLIPGGTGSGNTELGPLLANLPISVQTELVGLTEGQTIMYIMLVYVFAPFFLLIPAIASSVIASDSFAGEKERKTIEGLLATPLSDGELLVGKIMVAFVPSMIVTLLSFTVYTILVDLLSLETFNRFILPTINWVLIIFLLAPTTAITGIALTVIVSARVKGFREAQQLSVLIIVPIMGLVLGQMFGLLLLIPTVILILFAIFIVVDVIVLKIGLDMFEREEILSRIR
ncbi:MAG: ABC transporter permease subunit [Candidatus Bathyarchaeota archaeon]|jgi:ABC-2 type transport system permease protein|nr:ABC transporter permease subunit [Candidatus Bathyarchaeota archaeon]